MTDHDAPNSGALRTKSGQRTAGRPRNSRDSHKTIAAILDHQETAVVFVSQEQRVEYLNAAAQTLLLASAQQAIGEPLQQICADLVLDEDAWHQVVDDETPITKRASTLLRRDGSQIHADYSLIPVPSLQGVLLELNEINRLVRIGRDDQFVTAQETSKQLVRGLAHEVKNPLGGIRGAAQLLQIKLKKLATTEVQPSIQEFHEYTGVIIAEADRLTALVDRMLGPNQPLAFAPVNIHEILARVERLILAEARATAPTELRTRCDFDPSLPNVPADAEQLLQAILNIVRNAMQALEHTTDPTISMRTRIERQFTIGATRHRMVLCLDIRDNGPGIPDSILDRIFFPMITTRVEGTGLGLAITQNIIGQHNGLLEVESRPGDTRFSIYLPVAQT